MADPPGATEDMRRRADWMVGSDDRVLELLREHGNLTPGAIDKYGGPSAEHASRRLNELARGGLVLKMGYGLFRISEAGRAYLDEDLDASELELSDEPKEYDPYPDD